MAERSLLSGAPTVEVNLTRYDELLHKEAIFDRISKDFNVDLFIRMKEKTEATNECN